MTNEKAIEALNDIKTYAAASSLTAVDYAIGVLQKMIDLGIDDPLNLEDVTSMADVQEGN